MKPYILLPFVLLAGLVIGGLGPRSELERLREELEEAKKLARGSGRGTAPISEVSGLLGIERSAGSKSESGRVAQVGKHNQAAAGSESEDPVADEEAGEDADAVVEKEEERPERNFEEDLDRAIELWQTRVAIARNTFVSNTRLNDKQALKLDTVLAAMNIRIGTTIDEFAKEVSQAETVQPEAGIRLVNDITESMVVAYDELDDTMPKGWRRRAGDKFTMTDFIDPEVARPLAGVEGRLERMVH